MWQFVIKRATPVQWQKLFYQQQSDDNRANFHWGMGTLLLLGDEKRTQHYAFVIIGFSIYVVTCELK